MSESIWILALALALVFLWLGLAGEWDGMGYLLGTRYLSDGHA